MTILYRRPGTKHFSVSELERDGVLTVSATASSDCFNDLIQKLDEFDVTDLRLLVRERDTPFLPHFEDFKKRGQLSKLSLSGGGNPASDYLSHDFDFGIFESFGSLEAFSAEYMHLADPALDFMPGLKWLYLTWNENKVSGLSQKCPELQWLRIDQFRGPLFDLGPLQHLTDLRLYSASIDTLDGIATLFPKLETLIVADQRRELDVSSLAECTHLRHLKFDAFTKTKGIEDLRIPSLEMAYLSKLDGADFFENNPQLSFMRVKKYTGEPTQSMLEKGWLKIGAEHGTHDGFVPEPLRK